MGSERFARSDKFDPEARVAMLTGLGQRHIVLEALNAGARDFVVKPFKPERVLSAVRKLLEVSATQVLRVRFMLRNSLYDTSHW